MKNKILILVLIISFFNCKAPKIKPQSLTLGYFKTYIENLQNNNVLSNNPLLIYNENIIGSLDEVDFSTIDFQLFNVNDLEYLQRNSNFYEFLFGKEARNGVVIIKNSNTVYLHCGGRVKKYLVLDGNRIDYPNFDNFNWDNLTRWSNLHDIRNKNGDFIELTIFESKNNSY